MPRKINIQEGMKFGRLTVLHFSHHNEDSKPFWMCECDCGTKKPIQPYQLKTGRTKSCGCYRREVAAASMPQNPGWCKLKGLPIKQGGRTLRELSEITGISNQAISQVEMNALEKLGRGLLKLGITSVDIRHYM